MPDMYHENERALRRREGQRIVDIALGKGDIREQIAHYLVIERPDLRHEFAIYRREIEQYRDIERAVAVAKDCETGDRDAKCLGGFSAVYQNGRLVSIELIDFTADLMPVHPDVSRNMMLEGE